MERKMTPREAVSQIWLNAAARLDIILAIFDGEKQEHALIAFPIANSPLSGQLNGKVLDRLVAYSIQGDERELDAELLLYLAAETFQLLLLGRDLKRGQDR